MKTRTDSFSPGIFFYKQLSLLCLLPFFALALQGLTVLRFYRLYGLDALNPLRPLRPYGLKAGEALSRVGDRAVSEVMRQLTGPNFRWAENRAEYILCFHFGKSNGYLSRPSACGPT